MFAGADPGYANGCLAILYDDDSVDFYDVSKSPTELKKFASKVALLKRVPILAVLEKVGAMPRQGISSALNFGRGIGWFEAVILMAGTPYREVRPATWQVIVSPKRAPLAVNKDLPATEKSKLKAQNKRMLKEDIYNFCRKRFPKVEWRSFNKDTNRADALAMALYARMLHTKGH